MGAERGDRARRDYRLCGSCGGRCWWSEDAWVCGRCGSEWAADHGAEFRDPGCLPAEAVYRVAARDWRCVCATVARERKYQEPNCADPIRAGDPYIEYMGEAPPYGAGHRYCLPCGLATWSSSEEVVVMP